MSEAGNARVMVLVRLSGRIGARRDWSPFLRSNPSTWRELGAGHDVEFPRDEVKLMRDAVDIVAGDGAPPVPAVAVPTPKRVVKDNYGNLWHDGKIVSGPHFPDGPPKEQKPAEEKPVAKEEKPAAEQKEKSVEGSEGSPSTEGAPSEKRKKRRKRAPDTSKSGE